MDTSGDINVMQGLLIRAMEIINDPVSSSADRLQAHQTLQEAEQNVIQLLPLVFQFINKTNPCVLRQFGLHLLENLVRHRWKDNCFSDESRLEIRQQILMNVQSNLLDIDHESSFVKECYARCLNEMAKKDYPQKWSTMVNDSQALCSSGHTQHLVLISFWTRFFEDVIFLQNVEPAGRRRDLHNYLMEHIESFFCQAHKLLMEQDNAPLKLRLANLEFLSLIMQIMPSHVLRPKSKEAFSVLYNQLVEPNLALVHSSTQCLSHVAVQKGGNKDDNAEIVLNLASEENMHYLLKSVQMVFNVPISQEHHECLKTFGALLITLGHDLSLIWDNEMEEKSFQDGGIESYVDTIFAFLAHPSVVLRFMAATACNSLSKNDHILTSKSFKNFPGRLIEAFPIVTQLIGFPSKGEPPHSDYSRLEFDVDLLFLNEFCRSREALTSALKKVLKLNYSGGFKSVCQFIHKLPQSYSTLTSHEWDANIRFMDIVVSCLAKTKDFDDTKVKDESRNLIEIVLRVMTNGSTEENASLLLSTLSSLFPFLRHHSEFVVNIVERIFSMSLWPNPDTSELSRKIRHHAMHEFVHLAIEQTIALLPFADRILEEMHKYRDQLTLRQKCSLAESFIVLGNQFTNFEQKKELMNYLTAPSVAYFTSSDLTINCSNPIKFAKYIGLCDVASEIIVPKDEVFRRRKDILGHVVMLVGILNRYRSTSETKDGLTNASFHPAFETVKTALNQLFCLARCLNGLYTIDTVKTFHPSFKGYVVLDLIETEKNLNPSSMVSSPNYRDDELRTFDHIRLFVADTTEKLHTLIGLIVSKFDRQFYDLPESVNYLSKDILASIDNILDQRLRFCIRRCFLPIVSSVKPECNNRLLPSLNLLINHTHSRLCQRWTTIKNRLTSNADNDQIDNNVDLTRQEIFLQDSTSTLTRDYLNLLKFAIALDPLGNRGTKKNDEINGHMENFDSRENNNDDDEENIEMKDDSSRQSKQQQNEIFSSIMKISPLGVNLLDPKYGCAGSLTLSVFNALTWFDTHSATKACELGALIAKQLLNVKLLDDSTAEYLFNCSLMALQVHGEHDVWLGRFLGFTCYLHEILWPHFPSVKRIMLELPGVDSKKMELYERKLKEVEVTGVPLSVKFRRDYFKRLVQQIIGKNVGQKFKNKVNYSLDIPILTEPQLDFDSTNNEEVLDSVCQLFSRP